MEIKPGTKDYPELYGIYLPAADAKACIIFIHGLGDHISRYDEMASFFNEHNYSFTGVDLPGHGRSPGKRGHIKDFGHYRDIISSVARFVREREGGIPLILYGHSLGGNIALNYLQGDNDFEKGIITSAWIKLAFDPPLFKVILASLAGKLVPSMQQPSGLNADDISSDREAVHKYRTDPLVHPFISVRLYLSARAAAGKLISSKDTLKTPVLMMHSSNDRIVSAEGSLIFAENNSKADLKIWDKGLHELHNEVFREEVFIYIIKWLEQKDGIQN